MLLDLQNPSFQLSYKVCVVYKVASLKGVPQLLPRQGSPDQIHHSTNSPNPNVLTNYFRKTGMSLSLSGLLAGEGAVQRLGLFRLSLHRFCSVLIQSLEAILLQDMFQVVREVIALKCTTAASVMSFFCFSHKAAYSFMVDYFTTLTNLTPLWTDGTYAAWWSSSEWLAGVAR